MNQPIGEQQGQIVKYYLGFEFSLWQNQKLDEKIFQRQFELLQCKMHSLLKLSWFGFDWVEILGWVWV